LRHDLRDRIAFASPFPVVSDRGDKMR